MDFVHAFYVATIIDDVTRQKNGGTFKRNSGVPVSFTSGYVVGGLVDAVVYDLDDPEVNSAIEIGKFIQQHDVPLIGTWVENGQVFVDAVEHIEDQDQAIQKGIERQQQAIWDVANNEEIYILS